MAGTLKKTGPFIVLMLTGSVQAGLAAELRDPEPCSPCLIGKLQLIEIASCKTKILADDLFLVDPDKFVWNFTPGADKFPLAVEKSPGHLRGNF